MSLSFWITSVALIIVCHGQGANAQQPLKPIKFSPINPVQKQQYNKCETLSPIRVQPLIQSRPRSGTQGYSHSGRRNVFDRPDENSRSRRSWDDPFAR